jgi:hypothetical protein
MPADFRLLRSWDGSKDRAFEEICYQLLREPQDLPPGMVGRTIRTGNPDGGVEWYTLSAGSEQWGWQAKYIWDIESLLSAMTGTVNRVVLERPTLTKLTFCIPWNLPAGTRGGERTSARQKYDSKIETWKSTIPGAEKIEFELVQGSDLLDRLAQPQHAGRQWFWWNERYLGPDWLATFQREQSEVAGDRYRPDLQVDVPIQEDLSALGFADSYFEELDRHLELALRQLGEIGLPPTEADGDLVTSAAGVTAAITMLREQASGDYQANEADPLEAFDQAVTTCAEAMASAEDDAQAARAGLDDQLPDEGRATLKERLSHYVYRLRRAENAVSSLRQFLDGSATRAVRQRFYFLTGASGTGKTHLCLDAAGRALGEGRPALVLFGNRFGVGDLWASFCDQLGLPALGAEVLLGALEAAAEASGRHGRRLVVMVDALNDTKGEDYWSDRLPALRAKFAGRPLLALLVSCRDTYLDYVDPENRRAGVERVHPGFAGREFEATQKYFTHYGLEAPRIPLLLPEFTIPLFLLTYCAGLQGEGRTVPPPGHEGRTEIFERFLNVSLSQVTRKLHLPPGSPKARAALDALLGDMSATGQDSVEWQRAEQLTTAQIPERTIWPDTALGALLSQGLLSDEMVYDGEQYVRSVRVTYQAFSDLLILDRRLSGTTAGSPPDQAFAEWLNGASWGIREAAAVVLPERHAVELPDLLEPLIVTGDDPDSLEGRRAAHRMDNLDEMAVRSLPYRSAGAITDRSIELLNRHARTESGHKVALDVFLLCAPQPHSPLNADQLHRWLSSFSMPERDAIVGIPFYWDLDAETSPLSRLARWAANGPYPAYEARVVELASVPLVWMLSSPNRFMRDWTTKALARLLASHLDVAASLIERFADVNDPYVLERLITAVYGGVLRGGLDHLPDAGRVAAQVEQFIFARLDQLTPDALMLDAAQGIVEWAVAQGQLPPGALELAQPPYGLPRPGTPPTWERLEARYPHGEGTTHQTSYGSIIYSLHGLADFGRYVVDSGIQHFAKVPLGQPLPPPEPPIRVRFVKGRWQAFLRSLPAGLAAQAEALIKPETSFMFLFNPEAREFRAGLSKEQDELLGACWQRPQRRPRDIRYPSELARRWIVQRTMSLGWRPELFGEFDHYLNYSRVGRESHKPERFGKKYQWIAYHELLARVADNFHYLPYREQPQPLCGIWEINDREIDPSLPPVPYREFQERITKQGTWQPTGPQFPGPPPGSVDFNRYGGDSHAFLSDRDSLPYPDQIVRLTSNTGETWMLLDAHLTHAARPVSNDPGMWSDRQFYSLRSWLVPSAEVSSAVAALPAELEDHTFTFDLMESEGHIDCCYFGELGWREMHCPHQHDGPLTVTRPDGTTLALTPTVEGYTWEGVIWDCSIEASVHVALPSTFIQRSSNLSWSRDSATWYGGNELVMSYLPTADVYPGELFVVREDWLRDYLAAQGMALVFAVGGQRDHQDGPRGASWTEFSFSSSYDAGTLSASTSVITSKSTAEAS